MRKEHYEQGPWKRASQSHNGVATWEHSVCRMMASPSLLYVIDAKLMLEREENVFAIKNHENKWLL